MGCTQSTVSTPEQAPINANEASEEKAKPQTAVKAKEETSEEKPKPQIFAIMRNGHEVIRGGIEEVKEAIATDDLAAAKVAWDKLVKFEAMHQTMEEGDGTNETPTGMFRLLDAKVEEVASKNGLYGRHEDLQKLEDAVVKASDMEEFKAAFSTFAEANESHLKQEEDVMMPSVQKLKQAGEPLKKFMIEEILATVSGSPDFEFFVKYANVILEKHHGGKPRVRVFDHALWAAATPEQWETWNGWMHEVLTEKSYAEVQAAIE